MKQFAVLLLTISLLIAMSVAFAAGGQRSGRGDGNRGGHQASHQGGYDRGGHRDQHYDGRYRRYDGGRHHSHSSFVFSYGGYYGYPFPYYPYYPYGYPGQIVIREPAAPVIYIEQSDQSGPYYWYYCTNPTGYYPYVEECPAGWMQVVPQAPPP